MNSRDLQVQINEVKFVPKDEKFLNSVAEHADNNYIKQRLQEEMHNVQPDYKLIARLALIAMYIDHKPLDTNK